MRVIQLLPLHKGTVHEVWWRSVHGFFIVTFLALKPIVIYTVPFSFCTALAFHLIFSPLRLYVFSYGGESNPKNLPNESLP